MVSQMSPYLHCSTADCEEKIFGTEGMDVSTGRNGNMTWYHGEDLMIALNEIALLAGWHWDGYRWLCMTCHRKEATNELTQAMHDMYASDWQALIEQIN